MKAVILAGGLGKRLRPITETVPKPLVPVCGKPVVEYTLENLPSEIQEVIFVIGYKGEMIKDLYGDFAFGRKISYAVQEKQLGTGHAIKCAAPLVDTPFLLLYGDDIYGAVGLQKLVQREWALLARRVEHPERFGVLELNQDGTVKDMIEKPQTFVSDLSWVGAAKLQPEFLKVETPLSPRGEYEVTDMVNVLIKQGKKFYAELTDVWLPANTHEEVAEAERCLKNRV